MSENGIKTTVIPKENLLDEIIGNKEQTTVSVPFRSLASQLVGTGAVSDALRQVTDEIGAVDARVVSGLITKATWAELTSLAPTEDGAGGEVLDSDEGSHTDPIVGGTVKNAGRYSYILGDAGWLRVGDSGLARKADRVEVEAVRSETIVDPFPASEYEVPSILRPYYLKSPSSGLTVDDDGVTVADAGRFYAIPNLQSLGLAVGDTVRVAFRRLSGVDQPTNIAFYAGTTLISTVLFKLIGGWYVAQGPIPATTTIIRTDWTNSTGSAVKLTWLQFAVKAIEQRPIVPARNNFYRLLSSGDGPMNLWPGISVLSKTLGTGDIADGSINEDGSATWPAEVQGQIRTSDDSLTRDIGDLMTFMVRVATITFISRMWVRFVGTITGTQSVEMQHLGDDWWYLSGPIPEFSDQTSIRSVYIEIDNRTDGAVAPSEATISEFMVFDGLVMPDQFVKVGVDTDEPPVGGGFSPTDVVVTQSAGSFQIAMLAGATKYARWTMGRYDDAPSRALGWRQTLLEEVTRTGEADFSGAVALTDDGEVEVAILEIGKSDFMGGSTHGDMQETRDLTLIVDGTDVTLDGTTSYVARRAEAIQQAHLLEVDNEIDTLSATLVTNWVWQDGLLRLRNWLRWERDMLIKTCYLTMLPPYRHVGVNPANPLISGTLRPSPQYAPFDISDDTYGLTAPYLNAPRNIITGDRYTIDIEIVKGWTAQGRSRPVGNPSRNKIYYLPFPVSNEVGVAVNSGDIIEWESVYRIGIS
ncbi:hypothetical protein GLP59_10595 [Sulfitobacter sp. M220]|uniref:hypothetical protein n=1 Tax=Sulfitobacter sp. M220 TaxID=2675333 RepID=UPI001F40CF53|nr:hypothetical protein [Sulfitobacter sp. M220]MCF7778088.1 hypothetical protein [Sulfitobacter sp. M220]